jgi:hypothetical protein
MVAIQAAERGLRKIDFIKILTWPQRIWVVRLAIRFRHAARCA